MQAYANPMPVVVRPVRKRSASRAGAIRFRRLSLLVLVAAAAFLFAPKVVQMLPAEPNAPVRTYTVSTGETLWSIASQASPGADTRKVIAEIKRINHLSTVNIQPGQVLVLPPGSGL